MGGRRTNLALLGLLGAAFLTGWLAFSFNSWSSRTALVVHGVAGLAIIGLLPWKSLIARRSLLRRGGAGWLLGGSLALLLLVSIVFGLLHSGGMPYLWTTPALSSIPVLRELTAMELHVGAALALARRAGTLDRTALVVMAFPLTIGMILYSWVDIITMAGLAEIMTVVTWTSLLMMSLVKVLFEKKRNW